MYTERRLECEKELVGRARRALAVDAIAFKATSCLANEPRGPAYPGTYVYTNTSYEILRRYSRSESLQYSKHKDETTRAGRGPSVRHERIQTPVYCTRLFSFTDRATIRSVPPRLEFIKEVRAPRASQMSGNIVLNPLHKILHAC